MKEKIEKTLIILLCLVSFVLAMIVIVSTGAKLFNIVIFTMLISVMHGLCIYAFYFGLHKPN